MLPFWTSFLIRTYAWMFLLRDTGLINSALQSLHVIRQPLPLLFNTGAVILGLVYGYLPFMILPLYASLEKLDPALLDAAADLGATPLTALWRVVLPLTRDGDRGWLPAGLHSMPGRLFNARSDGRWKNRDGRQSGSEPIHKRPRLALWSRHFTTADGACVTSDAAVGPPHRGSALKRFLLSVRLRRLPFPLPTAGRPGRSSASTLQRSQYGGALHGTGMRRCFTIVRCLKAR